MTHLGNYVSSILAFAVGAAYGYCYHFQWFHNHRWTVHLALIVSFYTIAELRRCLAKYKV